MTILKGVDVSFDGLDDAEAERLKAAGVTVWAQCLWTGAQQPPPRVTNLRIAQQNGFILMGYISVTGSRGGYDHVAAGRNGIPQDLWDALTLVAVDVELDGIPNTTVRQAVDGLFALGKRRCIYTSWNCWVNKQGNPKTFTDCLLWNAYWDGAPDIDFPGLPYGGWALEQVMGEQWSGGQYLEGVFVDRDTFIKEILIPQEVDMSLDRTQRKAALRMFIAVADGLDRGLANFFDPIPADTWAAAWRWVGVNTPPPQPRLEESVRETKLVARR